MVFFQQRGGAGLSGCDEAAQRPAVAGSIVTRFAWVQAGKASAGDARIPLELPEQTGDLAAKP